VCYFLYIASPLTLSEVRAMLPAGASADLADLPIQQRLKSYYPGLQTVARLLIGRCSCGFVRLRHPERQEDERHLRLRYRELGIDRAEIIAALDRHRRAEIQLAPPKDWSRALADFVAEHARNAGPSLYLLVFSHLASHLPSLGQLRKINLSELQASAESWLVERVPTLVVR
jgi:hypothetical protein